MQLSTQITDGICLIRLTGKLMGGPESHELRQAVKSACEQGRRAVIVDLEEVSWINSWGLGQLVAALTSLKSCGGSMRVACANDKVAAVMKLTRFDSILELCPSVEEARARFTAV